VSAPAVLLMGPTASGKSVLAMQLAEVLPVEIISVDSAQVFRGMDIGTAKPDAADRSRVPHHLIDILEPTEAYSAARFREDSIRLAEDIRSRGRLPLLVGGTMLYFKALREGLSVLPQADAAVRAQIDAEAGLRGWPAMHSELAKIDPATAMRLEPNDSQRVQRAIEIFRLTGSPMSRLVGGARSHPPFPSVAIALVPGDRAVLHARIEARFDAMLQKGLVEELRSLRNRHALSPDMPSMRSVGYRQAWQFLEGELDAGTLRERGIHATRQLAKRQLTWLRSMRGLVPIDPLESSLGRRALEAINRAHA
jgi:tRNA dimethylallyltransferase